MNRTEHLLTILAEECNEVGQRCAKASRFSLGEVQPGQDKTNAERICVELTDLFAIVKKLHAEGHINFDPKPSEIAAKDFKVEKYMTYAIQMGSLILEPGERDPREYLPVDAQRLFPGGIMDDSTFGEVETALDEVGAPIQAEDGRWLSLPERIRALVPVNPATD